MNPKYKKIYCCTPVSFIGGESFFTRDTGLISKTLRSLGVESKCIMPLPWHEGSLRENIIRTEYKNLESVEWWKSLGIDALVLYSWGAPRYRKIARAVHKAGIRLHIHLDTSGNFEGNDWETLPIYKKIVRFLKVKIVDFFRVRHLKYADIITVTPPAAQKIRKRPFYGRWFEERLIAFPAPVATCFKRKPDCLRQRKVVCVGRWSDEQVDKVKRPEFMLETAKEIVAVDPSVVVSIYGRVGDNIRKQYGEIPEPWRARIHLKGVIANEDLPLVYNTSQVSICTSYSEGTHIASAEAICSGCSLVIPPRESLSVLHWYTSHNSGSVAKEDTPESMAQSVIHELNLWEQKQRNPHEISEYWQAMFHVDKALHRIFEI